MFTVNGRSPCAIAFWAGADQKGPGLTSQTSDNRVVSHDSVLAALPETILQVGPDMEVLYVNRRDSDVFVDSPEVGDHLSSAFDAETVSLLTGLIDAARKSGTANGEFSPGSAVYGVSARAIEETPTVILVFRDVTSRRLTEKALMEMMRDKSTVLESVGNELRAPLSAVIAYANLLAKPDPDLDEASRSAMVEHMADQAWDLAGIVDDLMAVAHTEIGDLHVADVPVSLFANTAQVLESMGERGLRITVTGERPVTGVGDPARFRQIVRNLISNALTHGLEPVTVDVRSVEDWAVLSVKDRGPGVPEDVEARELFTRSSKLEGSTRVGIGLWISRELAELMNGSVEYAREHGLTVFRVKLPLLVEDD